MIQNISQKGTKLFPRSQIPNSHGFRLIGVDAEGVRYRCEVVKGADGVHRVEGMDISSMVGWTNEVGII